MLVKQFIEQAKDSIQYYYSAKRALRKQGVKVSNKMRPERLYSDYCNPYSGYKQDQEELDNLYETMSTAWLFENKSVRTSLLTPEQITESWGNKEITFVDKHYLPTPYLETEGIMIRNYGIGELEEEDSDYSWGNYDEHISLVKLVYTDGQASKWIPVEDFDQIQIYQVFPMIYFRIKDTMMNEDFPMEENDAHEGMIVWNPLYNQYCLYLYAIDHYEYGNPFDEVEYYLLPHTTKSALKTKTRLKKLLEDTTKGEYAFSHFQLCHWYYGPHSYICRQASFKRIWLPEWEDFQDAFGSDYDIEMDHATNKYHADVDPNKPNYTVFPKDANENSMKFVGEKSEKYFNSKGVYLLLGKDKADEKWLFKVGRATNLSHRERLYSLTSKAKNTRFKQNGSVLVVNFISESELDCELDLSQYYGLEAIFRNAFNLVEAPKYPSEWFNGEDYDKRKAFADQFNEVKDQLLGDKAWLNKLKEKKRGQVATYVRTHLADLIKLPKKNLK